MESIYGNFISGGLDGIYGHINCYDFLHGGGSCGWERCEGWRGSREKLGGGKAVFALPAIGSYPVHEYHTGYVLYQRSFWPVILRRMMWLRCNISSLTVGELVLEGLPVTAAGDCLLTARFCAFCSVFAIRLSSRGGAPTLTKQLCCQLFVPSIINFRLFLLGSSSSRNRPGRFATLFEYLQASFPRGGAQHHRCHTASSEYTLSSGAATVRLQRSFHDTNSLITNSVASSACPFYIYLHKSDRYSSDQQA